MEWDIVENYYYWDMNPKWTEFKNKFGLYKFLIKKYFMVNLYQEKCNDLIKRNFYLKKELEYYKSQYKKLYNVRIKSKSKKMD